mmetsp:Transcript_21786/g.54294  ORF Transcript_21786/g.54294 Transcript_21786/m.54294 type:complete len:204 (-) Transcript_21786:63-674(-)
MCSPFQFARKICGLCLRKRATEPELLPASETDASSLSSSIWRSVSMCLRVPGSGTRNSPANPPDLESCRTIRCRGDAALWSACPEIDGLDDAPPLADSDDEGVCIKGRPCVHSETSSTSGAGACGACAASNSDQRKITARKELKCHVRWRSPDVLDIIETSFDHGEEGSGRVLRKPPHPYKRTRKAAHTKQAPQSIQSHSTSG